MVNHLDPVLSALADPTRRRVIELLGEGPLRASDLASGVGVARPAMSRHLGVLRSSGLVDVQLSEQDARARVYRLRQDNLLILQGWLKELGAHWNDELDRFKRHAENRQRRRPR